MTVRGRCNCVGQGSLVVNVLTEELLHVLFRVTLFGRLSTWYEDGGGNLFMRRGNYNQIGLVWLQSFHLFICSGCTRLGI